MTPATQPHIPDPMSSTRHPGPRRAARSNPPTSHNSPYVPASGRSVRFSARPDPAGRKEYACNNRTRERQSAISPKKKQISNTRVHKPSRQATLPTLSQRMATKLGLHGLCRGNVLPTRCTHPPFLASPLPCAESCDQRPS